MILRITVLSLLVALAGCSTIRRTVEEDVKTIIEFEEEEVVVLSSRTDECDRGIQRLEIEEWGEAVTALEKAVEKDADDDRAHYALGMAYYKLDQRQKALDHFKRAGEIDPKNFAYSRAYLLLKGV